MPTMMAAGSIATIVATTVQSRMATKRGVMMPSCLLSQRPPDAIAGADYHVACDDGSDWDEHDGGDHGHGETDCCICSLSVIPF